MAFALLKSVWESGNLIFRRRDTLAGVVTLSPQGMRKWIANTDYDTQNATILAAAIVGGLITHTSNTGAGTVTVDTGAHLYAAVPGIQVGEAIECIFINDGDQTDTLAVAAGITFADVGQTVAINESAVLIFLCTAADTFVMYTVGA